MTSNQTINRHKKSAGEIVGFSRNVSAYYQIIGGKTEEATLKEHNFDLKNMNTADTSTHKQIKPCNIPTSE